MAAIQVVFPRATTKVKDSVGFIANKIADDIDPNWSMSDNAMNTTRNKVFDAVYAYLYKSALKNYLRYSFYDDKLDDTFRKYSKIKACVLF